MVTRNSSGIATGATGTVLTGQGVGVTPTFQTNASVGAWQLVQTNSPSGAATSTFTDLVANTTYQFVFSINPDTNDRDILAVVSIDNGATWAATGYQSGVQSMAWNSTIIANINDTTQILICSPGASLNRGCFGYFLFRTKAYNTFMGNVTRPTSGDTLNIQIMGNYSSASIVNAVQFFAASASNITGTISLYKLVTT